MKYTFLTGIWLLFVTSLHAQQIKVLEQDSNLPIAGATLYNAQKTKSANTDIDGRVNLDQFSVAEDIYVIHTFYQKLVFNKSSLKNNTVYLIPKTENLDEVVVSASKFEQSKRDIPQKIINITAKSIQFSNPQTSADLLEGTGNIYIQKSQLGGGSPMIRGVSTNRLILSVDGVRLNNAIYRGGNIHNVISIDPFQ